jgi:hypothetical protein
MREGQKTQLVDTPETLTSPVVRKRRSHSLLLFPEQSHPSLRIERGFWSEGKNDIPTFVCSLWDFDEQFLEFC